VPITDGLLRAPCCCTFLLLHSGDNSKQYTRLSIYNGTTLIYHCDAKTFDHIVEFFATEL
jgi:hypothetical protein